MAVKGLYTLPRKCPVCGAAIYRDDRTMPGRKFASVDPPGLRRRYICGAVIETEEEDGRVRVDVIEGCTTALVALLDL